MKLNFYLEGAGLIIGIILWCASSVRYNIINLKDRIYVHMIRIVSVLTLLNIGSYFIIRKDLVKMMGIAEIIICISFFLMVFIWCYINLYLLETIYGRNYISNKSYMLTGLPAFVNAILILANWGNHKVFDVSKVDGSIQVAFNSWYKLPYILATCSFITYLVIIIRHRQVLIEKRQRVFYAIPFVMLVAYYFQYRFKFIAILGFSYMIVLLLLYIYSYESAARMDSLTKLVNRNTFRKMLDYRIGSKQNMIVAMISLDDFKRVNNEYGYSSGDKFIQTIAQYLKHQAPKKCLSRYGGDTFAIIFDNWELVQVQQWCEEILNRFEHSWRVGKIKHKLSTCITLVEYPALADSLDEILALLDYMNTYGKKNKKNQIITCDEQFKEKIRRREQITVILKELGQNDKMYVKYQPILDVAANRYTRGEALFRLRDDVLGDISPYEFFPIAEEQGYVTEIGYVLVEKVCQYIQSFIESGKEVPIISVNFSRQQIMAEDIEKRVTEILEKYNLSLDAIAFELPEEVFAMQYDAVKEQVEHLHGKGFRFYLDGFGTGLLDLTHLMELPFEMIKIDKNMIRAAQNNDSMYLLVSAMTAVFEENGKEILGGGIESESLKEMADMLFMNYLQGYYFSEPIPGEEAAEKFAETNVVEASSSLDDEALAAILEAAEVETEDIEEAEETEE